MTELVLCAVIVALLLFIVVRERAFARERRHLTNAVVAKNAGELIALDRDRQAKPREHTDEYRHAIQLDNALGV